MNTDHARRQFFNCPLIYGSVKKETINFDIKKKITFFHMMRAQKMSFQG